MDQAKMEMVQNLEIEMMTDLYNRLVVCPNISAHFLHFL